MSSSSVRPRRPFATTGVATRSWFTLLALGVMLAGCGFQLRGSANFAFPSIHVAAPPGIPFTQELKRTIAEAGKVQVLDTPAGATVILDLVELNVDKSVLSLSPGGRAREFLLVKRVRFSLRDPSGAIWLPQDEIVVRRTYLYDDTERLAREIQEQRLLVEMQTDAIAQIVRRLQAASKP
jgi:LPS-assembly lipoprotein